MATDALLTIDESGRVLEARTVEKGLPGDPLPGAAGVRIPFDAPDPSPLRLVLVGRLACPGGRSRCAIVLYADDGRASAGRPRTR